MCVCKTDLRIPDIYDLLCKGIDTAALQLSSSILDRTLQFLDIDSRVLNEEIVGTGHCPNCGGTPVQLEISAGTTCENINSQNGFTALPVKRKFSII